MSMFKGLQPFRREIWPRLLGSVAIKQSAEYTSALIPDCGQQIVQMINYDTITLPVRGEHFSQTPLN